MDGSCIDNDIDAGNNIGSFLSVEYGGTFGSKRTCEVGFLGIGSGDRKSFLEQDFCESAHADAADSDEMNVDRLIEI